MEIRKLSAGDRSPLETLLRETKLFTEAEAACALEIADLVLSTPDQKDYEFWVAVKAEVGDLLGFVCFGRAPLTDAVWDVYWIVVHPDAQKRKIGSALMRFVEEYVSKAAGRQLLIETSSTAKYEGTRAFYKRHGFLEAARIKDFYTVGDDKIVFGKTVEVQAAK
ncbi:MAG: GNAT family N-acetyltransferase [Planctomycetota bacterium]|nr:GNAT family N-acetyltransferase [Planctomycetota bacterium]